MTNILEIKPLIRKVIVDNLDTKFANNVYWIGERQEIPEAPYCVLSVIAENKDKPTSTHEEGKTITTLYKTDTITVCIYNLGVGDNYDIEKEFAYKEINKIEGLFETRKIHQYFYNIVNCSIQNISAIRPLHEEVDGGYLYRYEFDLTIGFNQKISTTYDISRGVDLEMNENNIDFTIEVDKNNVDIEIS